MIDRPCERMEGLLRQRDVSPSHSTGPNIHRNSSTKGGIEALLIVGGNREARIVGGCEVSRVFLSNMMRGEGKSKSKSQRENDHRRWPKGRPTRTRTEHEDQAPRPSSYGTCIHHQQYAKQSRLKSKRSAQGLSLCLVGMPLETPSSANQRQPLRHGWFERTPPPPATI